MSLTPRVLETKVAKLHEKLEKQIKNITKEVKAKVAKLPVETPIV